MGLGRTLLRGGASCGSRRSLCLTGSAWAHGGEVGRSRGRGSSSSSEPRPAFSGSAPDLRRGCPHRVRTPNTVSVEAEVRPVTPITGWAVRRVGSYITYLADELAEYRIHLGDDRQPGQSERLDSGYLRIGEGDAKRPLIRHREADPFRSVILGRGASGLGRCEDRRKKNTTQREQDRKEEPAHHGRQSFSAKRPRRTNPGHEQQRRIVLSLSLEGP